MTKVSSISPAENIRATEVGVENQETEVQKVHMNCPRLHREAAVTGAGTQLT